MRITDNIYIEFYNPSDWFCLGIYQEKTFAAWTPLEETDEELKEDDFEEVNRLVIGLFFGGITFLYR